MRILQRYIAKQVIFATALVFFIVTALSFVVGLLRELHNIGGDYGFFQATIHDLLLLPYTVYQLFPMLMLLGGVLGLGLLASSNELTVMRTSGVSVKRLIWSVILAACVLIVIATLLGEALAPHMNDFADKQKALVKSQGQAVATKWGVWIHEGNNFIHVMQVLGLKHLVYVTRYEFDDHHRLLAAYHVDGMDFVNGRWLLHHVVKTSFLNGHTMSQEIPLATWNLTLTPNLLNVGLIEPEAMSLPKLALYSHYLIKNRLQANVFRLAFWQRVFQPLATLVMILLSVPFVFTAPRTTTMGRRVLVAILIGFIFYILNAFVGQFSVVFQFPPVIAALVPSLVFALIGYGMMLQIKNR